MNGIEYVDQLNSLIKNGEYCNGLQAIPYNEAIFGIKACIQKQANLGKKIIFIGNGGSASIASHMAIDFWRNGGIRALCFNEAAQLTCISNDFGYAQVFASPIMMFADAGDILVAISSSGQSENILNAVIAAQNSGCIIITLSGFEPTNPLRATGQWNMYVPSSAYGMVELSHQIILHNLLDFIMADKK